MPEWGVLAVLLLTSCAGSAFPRPTVPSRIEIAETGCFGLCPVYEVSIDKAGGVAYNGRQYVAVVGERTLTISPSSYDAIARLLEAWRPTRPGATSVGFGFGPKLFPCDDYATDGGELIITWFDTDGSRRLVVDRGCRSPQSITFKTKVREALALLPSAEWSAQQDR